MVLDGKELAAKAKHVSSELTVKFVPNRRHDVLLGYSAEDNQQVLDDIKAFLTEKI